MDDWTLFLTLFFSPNDLFTAGKLRTPPLAINRPLATSLPSPSVSMKCSQSRLRVLGLFNENPLKSGTLYHYDGEGHWALNTKQRVH